MSDDKKNKSDSQTRNPMSTITIPPGSELELPSIPSDPHTPDFGKLSGEPSNTMEDRIWLEVLDRVTAISDSLHGPNGSIERLNTDVSAIRGHLDEVKSTLATDRMKDDQRLDDMLEILKKLVDAHSAHIQKDDETFEAHESRLNRQRADIDDTSHGMTRLNERVENLNKLAHENHSKLRNHDGRIEALEKCVNELRLSRQQVDVDGK